MPASPQQEGNRPDRTILSIGLPDDVSLPQRNALVADLLDALNRLNRSAGGSELEVGEIIDSSLAGYSFKQVELHGDVQHLALRLPESETT